MIQPARLENESLAMTQMIDRYKGEKKQFLSQTEDMKHIIFLRMSKKKECII